MKRNKIFRAQIFDLFTEKKSLSFSAYGGGDAGGGGDGYFFALILFIYFFAWFLFCMIIVCINSFHL